MQRFLLLGSLGMLTCILFRRKHFSLSIIHSIVLTLLLAMVGVAGAKLLFFFESGFRSWSGVSFFGSVFLIPILMPLFGLLFCLKPGQTMDVCAPCVAIMIAVLRINCLISGCCGGWVVYIGDYYFAWPTQIMESLADVFIFLWLLHMEAAGKYKGRLYPLFMLSYSVIRFGLEFLRYTPEKWLGLGHGQWFAILSVVIAIIWMKKTNLHGK